MIYMIGILVASLTMFSYCLGQISNAVMEQDEACPPCPPLPPPRPLNPAPATSGWHPNKRSAPNTQQQQFSIITSDHAMTDAKEIDDFLYALV